MVEAEHPEGDARVTVVEVGPGMRNSVVKAVWTVGRSADRQTRQRQLQRPRLQLRARAAQSAPKCQAGRSDADQRRPSCSSAVGDSPAVGCLLRCAEPRSPSSGARIDPGESP